MTTLNDVGPGDVVAMQDGGAWKEMRVSKVTARQVEAGDRRFHKTNGYEVCSVDYHWRKRIYVLDNKMRQTIDNFKASKETEQRRNEALSLIRSVTFRELSLKKLEAIAAVLRDDGNG